MKLSEMMTQLNAISKEAKTQKVDPEVRFLVLPNFPTSVSVKPLLVSTLDSSLSKETKGQGAFIYFAENTEEGPVYGEITERFGWGI